MNTALFPSVAKNVLPLETAGGVTPGLFANEPASALREASGARPTHLTPRQVDVLALLCEGLPNKRIARQLSISEATVKIHVANILRALSVSSRLQAVIAARRFGLTSESAPVQLAQQNQFLHPGQPAALRAVWDDLSSRLLAAASDHLLPEAVG